MSTSNAPTKQLIFEAIKKGVQIEVEHQYDEYMKELVAKLQRDKETICTGIVLHMMHYVQFETMKNNLVITIKEITK